MNGVVLISHKNETAPNFYFIPKVIEKVGKGGTKSGDGYILEQHYKNGSN